MHVSVIGSGYVGTTVAACLADAGHTVTAIDVDETVVETINSGTAPITEPGLEDLIATHAGDTLKATTSYDSVPDTGCTILAVGTPSRPDGSLDASALAAATRDTCAALADHHDHHPVVVKSTVTPPTIRDQLAPIVETETPDTVELATNPEFLREGSAVADFQDPDRLVFGTDSDWATDRLHELYAPLTDDTPVVETDPETAMMIKYANNAFLASKVSLANDIGNVCKEFGLDAYEVTDAIGLDDRISERFLRSGVGWGGSCFPKDVDALIAAATETDYEPAMLKAAREVNDRQPERLISLLERHVDLEGANIAVLGLAFKPHTDDTRNSRAIPVINGLQHRGATVVAYDPVADLEDGFPNITHADSASGALADADGCVVLTDWPEFAALKEEFDAMATPVVVDGRRIIERREGIVYEGLTW